MPCVFARQRQFILALMRALASESDWVRFVHLGHYGGVDSVWRVKFFCPVVAPLFSA